MTTNTTTRREAQRPALYAYHVTDGERGQKGHWHRLGAAFTHEDGKGFSLMLNSTPIQWDGRIVLRQPGDEPLTIADTDLPR